VAAQNEYSPDEKFEDDSLTYMLGYIANKFQHKHPDLVDTNTNNLNDWIKAKSFGTLTQPSTKLISTGRIIEGLFKKMNGKGNTIITFSYKTRTLNKSICIF